MEQEKLSEYIRDPGLLDSESLPRIKDMVERFPLFQSGWLLLLRNLKNVNSHEFPDYLRKAAPRIADRRKMFQYLHPEKFLSRDLLKKSIRKEGGLPDQEFNFKSFTSMGEPDNSSGKLNNIIDDFLKNQPEIRIRKAGDQESNVDLSEKSASEHDDFLTETLAEIYFRQNNFKKAIDSYEKLSLKFPEKSIYFAARIEEIKKLLKN